MLQAFQGFRSVGLLRAVISNLATEQPRVSVLVRRVYGREVEDGGLRGDRVQRLLTSMCGPSSEDSEGAHIH